MFGDDLIIKQGNAKIDSKGRIMIPADTGAVPDDKIIIEITTFEEEIVLKLYAYNKYLDIIEKIKEFQKNSSSLKEFNELEEEINRLCLSLNCIGKLDKQRRLLIPKDIFDITNWQKNEEVQYNGLGTSLLIRQKQKK